MIKYLRKLVLKISPFPIMIHAYVALRFGNKLHIRGRILQNRIVKRHHADSALKSFFNLIKSLLTDEKEHYQLSIQIDGENFSLQTDDDGYFSFSNERSSYKQITIAADRAETKTILVEEVNVNSPLSIISDIDDTILKTGVTSFMKWRLIFNTLFKNPWGRESFQNTAISYRQLLQNIGGSESNIFYISNSPWNLQSYLSEFLKGHNFPIGHLILRDASLSLWKTRGIESQNKYKEITQILSFDESHKYILVGDSGEIDADIYLRIAHHFPTQIIGIFIRDLKKSKRRKKIIYAANQSGFKPFVLFEDVSEISSTLIQHELMPTN